MAFKNTCFSLFLFVYYTNYVYADPINAKYKPELVQVLFRHGARTPIDCEAKILQTNESLYQPWGFAQLTNQGMTQEYRIGQLLREKYKDFLPDLYNPRDVYAYASGVGRTKASLELVLAALYPPTEELKWNEELNWMPIQIFSDPRPLDILIKSRNCPKYKKTLEVLYDTSDFKLLIAEHEGIREILKNIFGIDFVSYDDVFCTYNALLVHKNMNLPLPNWYTDELYLKLKKTTTLFLESLSYNVDLRRLNGGTLVRRFIENMNKTNTEVKKRKIYLYSAHDKTVHAYARSNNFTLSQYPDYGTAIILEKLSDESNNLYVRFLLWTGEPKKLTILKLPNCAEVCPLNEYLKIVNQVLPTDEEMLCLYEHLQPENLLKFLNTDHAGIDD